jgi:predicted Rossmann fold flavoprotein
MWERLLSSSGIPRDALWTGISNASIQTLATQLTAAEFQIAGKSTNKEEFVTCGGVKLSEVDFQTMQSKVCPGLYFAGELLDIDGITGGFNFQAAWTTGWIAGQSIAALNKPA